MERRRFHTALAEGGDLRTTAGFRADWILTCYRIELYPEGGICERLAGEPANGFGLALVPCGDQEEDGKEEIRAQEKGPGKEKDCEKSPGEKERATQSPSRSAFYTTTTATAGA